MDGAVGKEKLMRHSTHKTREHRSSLKTKSESVSPKGKEIFEELIFDHQILLRLCHQMIAIERKAPDPSKKDFDSFSKLLDAHTRAEEMVFYSTINERAMAANDDRTSREISESFEEHHVAAALLREAGEIRLPGGQEWIEKIEISSWRRCKGSVAVYSGL